MSSYDTQAMRNERKMAAHHDTCPKYPATAPTKAQHLAMCHSAWLTGLSGRFYNSIPLVVGFLLIMLLPSSQSLGHHTLLYSLSLSLFCSCSVTASWFGSFVAFFFHLLTPSILVPPPCPSSTHLISAFSILNVWINYHQFY